MSTSSAPAQSLLVADAHLQRDGGQQQAMGAPAILGHEIKNPLAGIKGAAQLLARQVDDFALGCANAKIAQDIIHLIGERVQLPSETKIPIMFQGIISSFNGYDVYQTADYIKLSAESYLRRVFKGHDWEIPAKRESSLTSKPKSPLTNDEAKLLYDVEPGPKEGSPEHAALARDVGYGYRNLLGEVLYSFVLCRLDISFAVTTLAKFSINPAREHYQALKRLAIYLRRHITWGIIYW